MVHNAGLDDTMDAGPDAIHNAGSKNGPNICLSLSAPGPGPRPGPSLGTPDPASGPPSSPPCCFAAPCRFLFPLS